MNSKMETSERLQQYLSQYHHKYPQAWKLFDELRACKNTVDEYDWQDWCFCPLGAAHAIISQAAIMPLNLSLEVGVLGGLAAWRATQGIYHFDETVFEAVWQTRISGNLPIEVLYRLPEWCLYIETPGKKIGNAQLNGFFVHLNRDSRTKQNELRFIFDIENELISFPLHLSKFTILESLESVAGGLSYQGEKLGIDPLQHLETLRELKSEIEPLISLTLYLCTQLSEIPEFDKRPPINYNSKQKRIYPPEKPLVWDVAFRLGAAIRKAERAAITTDLKRGERRRPRPHIRRAHWHGFWKGSKQAKQKYELKWLPPIVINVTGDNPIIPTTKQIE